MVSPEKIKEFHKYFCDLLEFDVEVESKKKSRTINLFTNQYKYEKALLNSYNNINAGNFEYSLFYINSIVDAVFEDFKRNITTQDSTLADQFAKHIQITKEVKSSYNDWIENDLKKYILSFENTELFKKDELSNMKEFDIASLVEIDNILSNRKLLKFYSYQQGSQPLDEFGKNISIGKKMVISKSLSEFLGHFGAQPQDDQTRISLIMKVEKRTEFSFFVLAIQHKDHLWIFTDVTDFDNPRNRESRRNDRCRYDYWDNLNLPYDLIKKIEKILSKKSTELQLLNNNSVDYALYPIENLTTEQKVYYLTLSNKCIDKIKFSAQAPRVITMGDFVSQKMIEGKIELNSHDAINTPGFEHFWDDACLERATELLEVVSLKQGNSGALVKINSDIILKDRNFDKDWLATPEHMENLTKWIALSKETNSFQRKLEFNDEEKNKAWMELDKMINTPENISRLHKMLFASQEVFFRLENVYSSWYRNSSEDRGGFYNEKVKKVTLDFCWPVKQYFTDHLFLGEVLDEPFESKFKLRVREKGARTCYLCGKEKHIIPVKTIEVRHYKQLLFLIGDSDRNKLPLYFRNYKSNSFVPYVGNSILDHLHPFSDLADDCSEAYVNGFNIDVIMCKTCSNRLHRENAISENTVIHEDFSLHKYTHKK